MDIRQIIKINNDDKLKKKKEKTKWGKSLGGWLSSALYVTLAPRKSAFRAFSGGFQVGGLQGQGLGGFLLVVGHVGLQALLGQQLPPGLQPLTAGTAPRLETSFMVACFTLFTDPALVELKGEDDVIFILAELTDEALGLAEHTSLYMGSPCPGELSKPGPQLPLPGGSQVIQ